ncbi:hypothetical protein J3458_000174 [Metarhizium acridum]|uniref:uncharacterized protein n=1 Tax=Metarhizium acridum TaxID=92637 RepID=UPI001C6C4AE7|nr:hypothetical protein J3458_000174 [Metarhizium acridum]
MQKIDDLEEQQKISEILETYFTHQAEWKQFRSKNPGRAPTFPLLIPSRAGLNIRDTGAGQRDPPGACVVDSNGARPGLACEWRTCSWILMSTVPLPGPLLRSWLSKEKWASGDIAAANQHTGFEAVVMVTFQRPAG